MSDPRLVAVDFDGTLAGPDLEPRPGAVGWLNGLIAAGIKVVVHSRRASTPQGRMWLEQWLCARGPFGAVTCTDVKPDACCFVENLAWNPVREGRFPTLEEIHVDLGPPEDNSVQAVHR